MISVITPMYNNEKTIMDTIQSVLDQTYSDWEMIIVDDRSSDNGVETVKRFVNRDHRIRLYELEENSGAAVARNHALEMAKGRYVAFLDADDCWNTEKLEYQLDFMNRNSIGFSYTNYSMITEYGRVVKQSFNMPLKVGYRDLLKNTAVGCSTVMIDRNVYGKFKMPLKRAGQDTATWLMLLRDGGEAFGIDEPLTQYRKVKGSVSSNKIKALMRTWETYRKFEKLRIDKAVYYFSCYIINAIRRRT